VYTESQISVKRDTLKDRKPEISPFCDTTPDYERHSLPFRISVYRKPDFGQAGYAEGQKA
jgi:hypothetical protein